MFGAESFLLNRCRSREVFDAAAWTLNGFKDYFLRHGETVYENPSPGNKAGGVTTLEDKSCGCVQKGGTAPVEGVLAYGERVRARGLSLLCGPGNDLVATTALAVAGAHLVLFSTGRPSPSRRVSLGSRSFGACSRKHLARPALVQGVRSDTEGVRSLSTGRHSCQASDLR